MREFSTPATDARHPRASLTDDVVRHVERDPDRVLFRRPADPADLGAGWADVSARAFRDGVVGVAKGLVAADVEPGDRVGVLVRNRYESALFDYACWWVGAVPVPVYESSSAKQVAWVLGDSAAVGCVVDDSGHASRVASVRAALPALRAVWTIDDDAVALLTGLGAHVDEDDLEKRRAAVAPDDLATLLYTSGTTGRPKGCRLTHANLTVGVDAAVQALAELFTGSDAAILLALPPADPFARLVQACCVRSGSGVAHVPDLLDPVRVLGIVRPTVVVAGPRSFEAMYAAARGHVAKRRRAPLLSSAASAAVAWSRAGGGHGLAARARHRVFDRLVYRHVRGALGGQIRYGLMTGASLGDWLGHFLRGVGVTVLAGYGLSEGASALTVNRPGELKPGTVGRPLPGVSVRVADDGELLFRGGQVFAGYWGGDRQAADDTADALAGGWLHTGDLGEVDGEGFVRVTGRKTEILVTAGGKKVAPAVLEDRIRLHPLVGQCMVVGEGRPYVAALVTLDEDAAASWAHTHARPGSVPELVDDPDVRDEIQGAVDAANAAVSQAESVRRFRVLADDWTQQDGHVTPSRTLRRARILRDHQADIEALYPR